MWDDEYDGHRVKYKDTVKDPQVLDIERFLNHDAIGEAQQKAKSEVVSEN